MNHRNSMKSYPQNLDLKEKKRRKNVVISTRTRFTKEAEVAMLLHSAMAAASSSYIASTNFPSILYLKTGVERGGERDFRKRKAFSVSAQVEAQEVEIRKQQQQQEEQQEMLKQPRPVEPQTNVQNKNLSREYGGQWLSCATRHVRIYAAYIDPETCAFDQTQMDKLTLILDPSDEFVWTDATCTQVYSYFQGLVDHYEVTTKIPLSTQIYFCKLKTTYSSG